MFGHGQKLYFFDQEERSRVRRRRKPVDQLPFSLPFTGVSGTLKVEAYLRQQMKISEATRDILPQTPEQGNDDKAFDAHNVKTKVVPQENEQAVARTARRGRMFATFSDYNEPDEEEDTQRFLFEENKFAAPNLLAHLGRILEILYETQADKNSAASARGRTFDNWANLTTSNNRYLDFSTSNFNLRAIGISIPFHLAEKLKWNFEQLIVNTVYTKRQWQTIGYKQQATGVQSVSEELPNSPQQVMSEFQEATESGRDVDNDDNSGTASPGKGDTVSALGMKSKKGPEDSKTPDSPEVLRDDQKRGSIAAGLKKSRKSTDEQLEKPLIKLGGIVDDKQENTIRKSQDSSADQLLKPTLASLADMVKQESSAAVKAEENNVRDGEVPKSVQGFRRESLKSVNLGKTPKTRLEKYKYIPDKSSLGK